MTAFIPACIMTTIESKLSACIMYDGLKSFTSYEIILKFSENRLRFKYTIGLNFAEKADEIFRRPNIRHLLEVRSLFFGTPEK